MDMTAPRFTDEDAAREHLEALRWPEGPFCPHCGSFNAKRLPAQRGRKTKAHPQGALRKGVVQCNDCREQYTVTVGTVFESSKIGLHKWVLATFLLCSSKRGMSGHQLARMLGVTQKTAWFMSHRIRESMRPAGNEPPLGGEGVGNMTAVLRIQLNRQGAVIGVPEVLDQTGVTGGNQAYARAFAESARRAVIRCSPLTLPAEYFDAWKLFELNFDPSKMN